MPQTAPVNKEAIAPVLSSYTDLPFYSKQVRIALKNCGIINPKNIDEYIARDGYRGLAKALTELTPDDVMAIMKDSGLARPRWSRLCHRHQVGILPRSRAMPKYVICNADEGDPGCVHGPLDPGRRPAQRDRGHDDCRLRHRR
jgi:NADH:ubiquinone oxidoreductase subunit F (NADH-binding)